MVIRTQQVTSGLYQYTYIYYSQVSLLYLQGLAQGVFWKMFVLDHFPTYFSEPTYKRLHVPSYAHDANKSRLNSVHAMLQHSLYCLNTIAPNLHKPDTCTYENTVDFCRVGHDRPLFGGARWPLLFCFSPKRNPNCKIFVFHLKHSVHYRS